MKQHQAGPGKTDLDAAVTALRDDLPPETVAAAAAERVRERLARESGASAGTVELIRGCADVRALLAGYRDRTLPPTRMLLVEDHLRECAVCRAAFRHPESRRLAVLPWRASTAASAPKPRRLRNLAVAAGLLIAAGLVLTLKDGPPGTVAAVQSVSGVVQRVVAEKTPALAAGETLADGERSRTARGAGAVLRLADGSVVEVGERAELAVRVRGGETTIALERGSIIVEAAKRRTGELRVVARDLTVSVTGTVFSVNHGLAGARVSVLEGEVRVARGGQEEVLAPGDQWTTDEAMGRVPLRDEIAWSRDLDRHLALLAEIKALGEALGSTPTPGARFESRLLRLLPARTLLFTGVPNYGEALADAHRLFEERMQESQVLRTFWREVDPERDGGPSVTTVVEKIRGLSEYLGDEIVLAAVLNRHGRPIPVLLAEVRRPGLREFLERELGKPADAPLLLRPDLAAVSPDASALDAVAERVDGRGPGLVDTPFGARIVEAYAGGVQLLFAVDLGGIRRAALDGEPPRSRHKEEAALRRSGFDGVEHLIVEGQGLSGPAAALMSFTGPRRGVPSWLAAPAPMGSLDFLSPHAQGAFAFVFKSPSLVLDDILGIVSVHDTRAEDDLRRLESHLDLRLREDLAETLGGEFAFALDGPLLPTPAWKLVVEVYDPERLQASLQLLVDKANDAASRAGRPGLRLEAEHVQGRTYYSLRGPGLPFQIHYTMADGYLVAAGSRAFVMRALLAHDSGTSLAASEAFQSLFPPDRRLHVSGVVYQNFAPLLGELADVGGSAPLTAEQRGAVEALARDAKPTLVCVYGEEDAIRVAAGSGLVNLDPGQLALPLLLERALPGTGGGRERMERR
jgi:ferric-dicitrate binding protein FerR (iron transport regulator)